MNSASTNLSQGCILELYKLNKCEARHPIVQIIDFQQSQANEKEISIRISDSLYFIDCTLSGNYFIQNDAIIETKNSTILTTIKRQQFVKLIDFFNKIDESKICKLQIIIRKMLQISNHNEISGNPQQIQMYIINHKKTNGTIPKDNHLQQYFPNKKHSLKEDRENEHNHSHKLQNTIIKIQPDQQYQQTIHYNNHHPNSHQSSQHYPQTNVKTTKKEQHSHNNDGSPFNQSLTLAQIMHGKDGYLIGKLLRFKNTRKQTKDGPMTVCYLGLVDRYNELIRIHLAGRLAMNNQKILRKNKCYYIRGFDLVNIKNAGTQIRLKDKEYKIAQVHNEQLTRCLSSEYYHWDHQSDCENEYVDVIGVIDDIEKKATYSPNNQLDPKSVIRVVIKNKYKSIRISFWTDQIKALQSFNLKKKETIIIEDIKKKQSKYYDFGFQSNLIQLNQPENQSLLQKFKDILPQPIEEVQPQNIRELNELFEDDPNNSKLRNVVAYLTHCQENKIVYRLCDDCKKKVEKNTKECHECGSQLLIFKYNCPLQFSDATGSIIVILFDVVANKLIGKTAMQINEMNELQIESCFENLFYKPYLLSIENRNKRIILRSIEQIDQTQQISILKDNIQKINHMIIKQIW